jgi:Ca2+/Na+ antiporter
VIGPQLGRAAFRIAFMMVAVSLVMLFVLAPGSAEYWVSILTLTLGLVFAGVIFFLVRMTR